MVMFCKVIFQVLDRKVSLKSFKCFERFDFSVARLVYHLGLAAVLECCRSCY